MCARFTVRAPAEQFAREFGVVFPAGMLPRYNIAPTQSVLAVRAGADGKRSCSMLRWGLIPSWAKQADGQKTVLVNARAETLAERPSFRAPFKSQRCLIPADGFYEWKHEANRTQPFYIHRPGHEPFAFAGLWDRWVGPDGRSVESCTIVTTEANGRLRSLDYRMPVILPADAYARWLDPRPARPADLEDLLRPFPDESLEFYPVGSHVNRGGFEDPRCVEPLRATQTSLWAE